jgi:hypothetical protein
MQLPLVHVPEKPVKVNEPGRALLLPGPETMSDPAVIEKFAAFDSVPPAVFPQVKVRVPVEPL